MAEILPAGKYREGRWPNGLGLSWDIAAEPQNASTDDFEWRLALAQIDASLPFSHYANVDRIFTLIAGEGLDLAFGDRNVLEIRQCFVPHEFPGDVKTECVLLGSPCRALNLFVRRQAWRATTRIICVPGNFAITSAETALAFALHDAFRLADGRLLNCGDTLQLSANETTKLQPQSPDAILYVATLIRVTV